MRFISYLYKGKEKVGFIENGRVYNIKKESMIDLIEGYEDIEFESIVKEGNFVYPDQVKIIAPIVKPIHDIICVGKNYKEHIKELGSDNEDNFVANYFGKRSNRMIGPNEDIKGRFDLDKDLDYEVELAVIIGKECKGVKRENALDYVFGYSIFNDLSSRNIQNNHGQWFRGKSLDNYSIMGPYIVTKEEVMHNDLFIKSYVNEELRQNSNTKNMIISVEEIIEELSSAMTLEVGDIISTGTPSGVGLGFNPPRFLKQGDIIKCEIEDLGSISNKII